MEITRAQYEQIAHCLPTQRGNVSLTNLSVLNAILYVAEQGCKWRGLPKRFGNWHTIYTRMNRWSKSGVLDRVFGQLQQARIVRIKIEAVSLDSTMVKVHPDGTGALKKRPANHWKVPRRMDNPDSSGCRGCSNRHHLRALARPGARCARGSRAPEPAGQAPLADSLADGPCLRGRRDPATGIGPGFPPGRAAAGQSGP